MLKFSQTKACGAEKKSAEERLKDFAEIYDRMKPEKLSEQASRCAQCGIPFCQSHCPLQNNIPDWLRAASEGRFQEAYELMAETNSFPEVCGKICPQDRLCEGHCVVNADFAAVTIGDVEEAVTEMAFDKGWVKPISAKDDNAKKVAIIGSGPAGLAAAGKLRQEGCQVTVFERQDKAGGLLTYGIPHFKLEKETVFRRIEWLKEAGVEFVLNTSIGKDIPFSDLQEKYDAILIATGVYQARELDFETPKEDCVQAFDFLKMHNRLAMGEKVKTPELKGKNVVVIGGGDTAMDCVRTAVRRGAASVKCVYRRDEESMPGSKKEFENAKEEGVEFEWLLQPKSFTEFETVELGEEDEFGRREITKSKGNIINLEKDYTIQALGFLPEDLNSSLSKKLATEKNGTVSITHNQGTTKYMTSLPGVFAAGDIVRGASLVVWAIKDGQEAASSIIRYLDSLEEKTDASL